MGIYFGPETDLSEKFWRHTWFCWLWSALFSRLLNVFIAVWAVNSNIRRGVTGAYLTKHTKVVQFSESWDGVGHGDPLCGICLADYEPKDHVRMLNCGHHFHTDCVDSWLLQYQNRCPFCQGAIGT